jgi:hypothetical protein
MPNTCDSLQKSVAWCEGTPVLPGIRKRLYYINKKLIALWPTLTKNTIGQVTTAKYAGDFTLAENATWSYIDILPDKSPVTSEPQGEYPSQTQLNKLAAVHPGTEEDATVLAAVMNNSNNVFIVQTANGKYRVVGSEMYDIKATVSQELGQGATGTAGTTINVEATDVVPAPFYEGEIVTAEGTVNEAPSPGN